MDHSAGFSLWMIIWLGIAVLMLASMWKVFEKAGQPGWGILIPIYNIYLLLQIAGRETWWLILYFIPVVNVVIAFIVYIDIAKHFGKDTGFGLGLFFLGFIFFPILGFGDATYQK